MNENLLLSYTRLASVFELNWTVLEPLPSCVGTCHPIVAAAEASGEVKRRDAPPSWLLCGGQAQPGKSKSEKIRSREFQTRGCDDATSVGSRSESCSLPGHQSHAKTRHIGRKDDSNVLSNRHLYYANIVDSPTISSCPSVKSQKERFEGEKFSELSSDKQLLSLPPKTISDHCRTLSSLIVSESGSSNSPNSSHLQKCQAPAYFRY